MSLVGAHVVSLHGSWWGLFLGQLPLWSWLPAGVPPAEQLWWQGQCPELLSRLRTSLKLLPVACWKWRQHWGEREERGRKRERRGKRRERCFINVVHFLTFVGLPIALIYRTVGELVGENFADCSLALPKDATPQICGETFAKVFSFENFMLYGTSNPLIILCTITSPTPFCLLSLHPSVQRQDICSWAGDSHSQLGIATCARHNCVFGCF